MNFVAFHGSPGSPRDFELLSKELPCVLAPARAGYERWFSSVKTPIEGAQIVLGYSWGSYEAIRYASALKTPPRALVLISSFLFANGGALKRNLLRVPGIGAKLVEKAAPSAIESFLSKSCDPDSIPAAYREAARELSNPEVLRWSVVEKSESPKAALDSLAALSRSVPVGVIHGASDRSGSLTEQIGPIRERISLAFEEVIPEGGHALIWTRPKQVAEILKKRFL